MEGVKNKVLYQGREVILEDNYLIRIVIKEHSDITAQDVREFQVAKRKLIGNAHHVVLFIPPKYGEISKDGRDASAAPETNINAIAKAVVARNMASLLVGNFFVKIHKPPVPTRLFKDEEEALVWLREMQKNFKK